LKVAERWFAAVAEYNLAGWSALKVRVDSMLLRRAEFKSGGLAAKTG